MSNLDAVHAARLTFEQQFDAAILEAERYVDLADIDNEEEQVDAYDERFHCEKCLIRGVMEIIWPSVDKYVTSLEKFLNYDHNNPAESDN